MSSLGRGKYKCGFLGFVFAKKKLPKMPRQNQEKIRFVGEQLLFRSDRDQRAGVKQPNLSSFTSPIA